MKILKLSTIALLFVMAVLLTSSFAQTADTDGDGVNDSEDLCVTVKGTKANKGCPEKTKKPEQTQNDAIAEMDLLKLEIGYAEEIDARDSKYKKLLEQYSTKSSAKVQRENLESRKLEMTAIKQICTKILANSNISDTSKKFFTDRLEDAEYHLKLVNTQLELVALDEKDSGLLGDDFLDKVLTDSKPQVKTETKTLSAQELNPKNEGKELYDAIEAGNSILVAELIRKGTNPNYREKGGTTLSLAVSKNNIVLVKTLLEAGANPNISDSESSGTPLAEAARLESVEMVKLLLKYKVNVNQKMSNGWTALHTAAFFNKDATMITYLIMADANPNIYANNGESPLAVAQRTGSQPVKDALYLATRKDVREMPIKKVATIKSESDSTSKNQNLPENVAAQNKRNATIREFNSLWNQVGENRSEIREKLSSSQQKSKNDTNPKDHLNRVVNYLNNSVKDLKRILFYVEKLYTEEGSSLDSESKHTVVKNIYDLKEEIIKRQKQYDEAFRQYKN